MEDNELIERYLRGELLADEVNEVEKRLTTDHAFKELFEIESVILKSLQYSIEKQRIKSLASAKVVEPKFSLDWLKGNNLLYAGGAALVVWLASNIVSGVLHIEADLIKWMGLMLAFILSAVSIFIIDRKFNFQLVTTSALNGLIIFVISSGIDAINQGAEFNSKTTKAVLVPYTQATVWWPTQSLVDSVHEQKKINGMLSQRNEHLNGMFHSLRDSVLNTRFDKFVPMVMAVSNTIAAGAPYDANVFLATSSSAINPTITVDGKAIPVEVDKATGLKMGRAKFIANGGGYDEKGIAKRTFKVAVSFLDSNYVSNIEYFVAKPTIKVTTGAAPTLYMGCGNEVNIEVPSLGTSYNPSFSITGGEIIKGQKIGNVVIIPNQRKVNVTVSNSGNNLGTEPFDVKNVPRPRVIARDNNGREIDLKNGIKVGSIAGLRINAEADENFKREVPKDANFRIRNMSVILARGSTRVQEMTIATESIDLSSWRSLMRPGDRILIEPKTVVRMTYKGTPEPVTVSPQNLINIPVQ